MFLHSLVNKPGVFGKLLPIQRTAPGMQELQKKTLGCGRGLRCNRTALGVHVCARQTAVASACVEEGWVHTCVPLLDLPVWVEGGVYTYTWKCQLERHTYNPPWVHTHTVGEKLWLYMSTGWLGACKHELICVSTAP